MTRTPADASCDTHVDGEDDNHRAASVPAAAAPFAEVQRFIVEQLRQRSKLSKIAEARRGAEAHLTGNDRLLPVEQLDIYRQQFWLRHTSSLVEDFPGLGGILGQRAWEELVEDYLSQVPPQSWTLRDLGSGLPEFVAVRSETPHQRLCVDMAHLEWLYVEAFDAAEAPPLDATKLASIDEAAWPKARIVLHPSLRLLRTEYPVAALRRELRQAAENEMRGQGTSVPIPERKPQNLALYRGAELGLRYCELKPAPMSVLEQLSRGLALEAACEAAATSPGLAAEIEHKVGAWFADWGKRGWVVDVVAPDAG